MKADLLKASYNSVTALPKAQISNAKYFIMKSYSQKAKTKIFDNLRKVTPNFTKYNI